MRFLSLLHSRLALVRFELAYEKKRCTILLLLILLCVLFVLLGSIFGALFLVFYFWEYRLLILCSCALFFFALAFLCAIWLPQFFSSTLFADSLNELQKDIEMLKNAS